MSNLLQRKNPFKDNVVSVKTPRYIIYCPLRGRFKAFAFQANHDYMMSLGTSLLKKNAKRIQLNSRLQDDLGAEPLDLQSRVVQYTPRYFHAYALYLNVFLLFATITHAIHSDKLKV